MEKQEDMYQIKIQGAKNDLILNQEDAATILYILMIQEQEFTIERL